MSFDDYTVVLDRQDDGSWVAEIPAVGGCYTLMDTREAALVELRQVFDLIALEHRERGLPLPTEPIESGGISATVTSLRARPERGQPTLTRSDGVRATPKR